MNKIIKSILEDATGFDVYDRQAPDSAKYPYIVFEARRLSVVDYIENFVLEVNVWDKYRTYSRVDDIAKKIDKALDHERNLDKGLMVFYEGIKQPVLDDNKEIKRIRSQFDVVVIERS